VSGLVPKLALFFLLLALPTLVLVDAAVLKLELHELQAHLADGALDRAAAPALAEISALDPNSAHYLALVENQLARLVARIQQPQGELSRNAQAVLFELDAVPVRAALVSADGEIKLSVPADWQPRSASDLFRFRYLRKFDLPSGAQMVWVGLDLSTPWWRALAQWRVEWPILLLIAAVFGMAGAWLIARYVTRRIASISAAAVRWSRGDFAKPIGDQAGDELGLVSRQLDQMAEQLKALMRERGERLVLEERARLARDLHDVVKQKAFALSLKLGAAQALSEKESERAVAQIKDARKLATEIQRDLVETIDDLRENQRGQALEERIRARAEEICGGQPLKLDLKFADPGELSADSEEQLLHVLSEALTNALRHAAASRVQVELRRDGDRVLLLVADDGRGLPKSARVGHGITGMHERAAGLRDGRLLIANEDSGTVVNLSFRP